MIFLAPQRSQTEIDTLIRNNVAIPTTIIDAGEQNALRDRVLGLARSFDPNTGVFVPIPNASRLQITTALTTRHILWMRDSSGAGTVTNRYPSEIVILGSGGLLYTTPQTWSVRRIIELLPSQALDSSGNDNAWVSATVTVGGPNNATATHTFTPADFVNAAGGFGVRLSASRYFVFRRTTTGLRDGIAWFLSGNESGSRGALSVDTRYAITNFTITPPATTNPVRTWRGATVARGSNLAREAGVVVADLPAGEGVDLEFSNGVELTNLVFSPVLGETAFDPEMHGSLERREKTSWGLTGLRHLRRITTPRLQVEVRLNNHEENNDPNLLSYIADIDGFGFLPFGLATTDAVNSSWARPDICRFCRVIEFSGWEGDIRVLITWARRGGLESQRCVRLHLRVRLRLIRLVRNRYTHSQWQTVKSPPSPPYPTRVSPL